MAQELLADAAARSRRRPQMTEIVRLDYQLVPFRAERFAALYRPALPRVLAYGAKSYTFYRSYDDPEHFVHESLWEDRADFQRYWFSREMHLTRERILGLYEQPMIPAWYTIVDRG